MPYLCPIFTEILCVCTSVYFLSFFFTPPLMLSSPTLSAVACIKNKACLYLTRFGSGRFILFIAILFASFISTTYAQKVTYKKDQLWVGKTPIAKLVHSDPPKATKKPKKTAAAAKNAPKLTPFYPTYWVKSLRGATWMTFSRKSVANPLALDERDEDATYEWYECHFNSFNNTVPVPAKAMRSALGVVKIINDNRLFKENKPYRPAADSFALHNTDFKEEVEVAKVKAEEAKRALAKAKNIANRNINSDITLSGQAIRQNNKEIGSFKHEKIGKADFYTFYNSDKGIVARGKVVLKPGHTLYTKTYRDNVFINIPILTNIDDVNTVARDAANFLIRNHYL